MNPHGRSPLPFARPDITNEEIEAVTRVLESGWLTAGPESDRFEAEFAERVGSPHAIAVNSATAALHLGLLGMGVTAGDGVIVPAWTFTASAEVVFRCGGTPLLTDVDRDTYLLTPTIVEEFILTQCRREERGLVHIKTGVRLRGIICVHYAGRVCDLDGLREICDREGWFLGEDAAHAAGSSYHGRPIGQGGDFCAFSFYATKNMTTGEGGMLTTPHDTVAHRLRRLRIHGIETPAHRRKNYYYDVVDDGYKYNMSDMAAALGRVQLRRSEGMMRARRAIHHAYQAGLSDLQGLRLCPDQEGSSYHLYTIEVDPMLGGRDEFAAAIEENGIRVGLHFIPLYRMTHYRRRLNLSETDFPSCEAIFTRLLSLPIYSSMTRLDIEDVISAVRHAHRSVTAALQRKTQS